MDTGTSIMDDEAAPLTKADLLAKLEDLETRLKESNDKELKNMEKQMIKATASKYRTLEKLVVEQQAQFNTGGASTSSVLKKDWKTDKASDAADTEKLPESTASFFLVAKCPKVFEVFTKDKDPAAVTHYSSSATLSIDVGSSDPDLGTGARSSPKQSETKPGSCCFRSVDWTSRDLFYIPFWFAFATLLLQVGIYFIIFANSTQLRSANPFKLPIGVDPWTRAAEILATAITVYSQADFFDGLIIFAHSAELVKSSQDGISSGKCYFAAISQVLSGVIGMLLTFLLIMQANDVIDLLLNFTAMEFVTNLDGIAFKLAENGYLWSAGEDTARAVTNTRFEKTSKRRVLKRWPHVFMAFVLYSLFVLVVYRQTNRVYGDNIVYIQFTDAIVPWLGTLSGSYVGTRKQAIRNLFGKNADVGIIVYEKKDQKEYCQDSGIPDCKRAFFFYCMKVKEWRFDLVGSTTDLNCDNWILRGSNDEPKLGDKYDILSHSSANWFAQDPKAEKKKALRDEVAVIKSFKAADYKEQELATLEATGVLFDAPYYKIVEDGSRVHDRPVYETFDLEFLAFNGYRWLLVRYDETECAQNCTRRRDDCFHFCLSTFDPFYSRYNASLISHPMELQTSGDTWVPSEELMWFPVTGEGNATQPDLEVKALPVLVSETIDIFENPEGLKDLSVEAAAKRLFAESSRLNKPTSEMPCEAGETSLVIELRTDLWPEETKMLVMEMKELMASFDAYNYREEEPDVAKLNFARAIFKNNTIPNDPLELAGHRSTFSLDDSSKTNVWGFYGGRKDKITTYRYGTCLPSTSCVGVLLHDKFSDDIALPGKFELYLDSKRVDLNKRTTQYCMYELGPSCATTVDCF